MSQCGARRCSLASAKHRSARPSAIQSRSPQTVMIDEKQSFVAAGRGVPLHHRFHQRAFRFGIFTVTVTIAAAAAAVGLRRKGSADVDKLQRMTSPLLVRQTETFRVVAHEHEQTVAVQGYQSAGVHGREVNEQRVRDLSEAPGTVAIIRPHHDSRRTAAGVVNGHHDKQPSLSVAADAQRTRVSNPFGQTGAAQVAIRIVADQRLQRREHRHAVRAKGCGDCQRKHFTAREGLRRCDVTPKGKSGVSLCAVQLGLHTSQQGRSDVRGSTSEGGGQPPTLMPPHPPPLLLLIAVNGS
jgi:hypothetical protein